jgi:hypothetical protein
MSTIIKIHPKSIIIRTAEVLFSRLDEEMLAIDAQAGYCYSLNESAGLLWDLISAPTSVNEICTQLCTEYTVDENTCLNEVLTLLKDMLDAGLIQVKDA